MGASACPIPEYVERSPQAYLAVRAHMARDALGTAAPGLLRELHAWLAAHGVAPLGKPFIRYLVVNYGNTMVDHGVRWQVREADEVTTWGCRVEHYLIGPQDEPNPERWQTEVAILVATEAE